MAGRIEQGAALVLKLAAALEVAGLDKALATLDAAHVASGSRYGVLVVSPGTLTFEDWGEPSMAWEVHVIAGPANDYLAAWDKIDAMIQALVVAQINLRSGEPGQFQPLVGEPLPAYTLTLNPLDI